MYIQPFWGANIHLHNRQSNIHSHISSQMCIHTFAQFETQKVEHKNGLK